ncbi:MAG: SAM-dependent methyltransferase [Lachnospiraceae bacterium]|nr:SAM-dependent methyltransferase [Lachnospiraceae bacterium]
MEITTRTVLEETINENLYTIILSNPRDKESGSKSKVRPIMLGGSLLYQESETKGSQIFHKNYTKEEAVKVLEEKMMSHYKQMEISTRTENAFILVSKKGKITIKRKKITQDKSIDLSHNKEKHYILEENKPIPCLVDLGIQTEDGKIKASKYDKFKQINRYLEFVEDILPHLPKEKTLKILDFGCGKSYLTFALYYYLKIVKEYNIEIIGLDLKEKVIENCNLLAEKYGYEKLRFLVGDIGKYEGQDEVDMVVTLHACDTATDYALYKAICWNAKVIFSVPCCQHEVNKQIENEALAPILKYGYLKERISALLTDGIRANLLEEAGYKVQVMEFIDMEHTPKNLLIRAVKTEKGNSTGIEHLTEFFHLDTTLQKLLSERNL